MTTIFKDIGPDTTNGMVGNPSATSGLTIGLAGDVSALYAVSLSAGVWKSVKDGQWMQLAHSPQYAYCSAVDPNNAAHIAVGERDGDAIDTHQNRSGVWESFDAGNSWSYSFDPLSLAGCTSQAIPAVVFSRQSTLFIATSCGGIGRKPANAGTFDFSSSPVGGQVTALSASESKVWARTSTQLLVSPDDGVTWTTKPIRTPLSVGGTTYNITFGSTGGLFSLAAVDAAAYMFFKPNPDVAGNRNTLLVYNVATDSWTVQVLSSGDGTGLGGRRFIKTFILNRPDLPMVVGKRLQLFLGVGQDMSQATGLNSDGTLQLVDFAHSFGSGAPTLDPIHSDIWDFHIASDGSMGWVACDGGVYQKSLPAGGWVTYGQGLQTHHIHTLTVLPTSDFSHGLAHSRLAYATADNGAWWRGSDGTWAHENSLGDANWTAGDAGNPAFALLIRNLLDPSGRALPILVNFTNNTSQRFTVVNDRTFNGPTGFQFIQTLQEEPLNFPQLDAVMLTNLPLKNAAGNPLPDPPGGSAQGPRVALLRNTKFAINPDGPQSQFRDWRIELDNLPLGCQRFWVSGGHIAPVYYFHAINSRGCASGLFRWSAAQGWSNCLLDNVMNLGVPNTDAPNNNTTFGPIFVNPYDPNQLFVLTGSGIMASGDSGSSFRRDDVLTALLTGSGKFPLTGNFRGSTGQNLALINRASPMATLSHIAFNRDRPREALAVSPFTGVFFNGGDGTWLDLSVSLPQPLSPFSSIGSDYTGIYVVMEGRSLVGATTFHSLKLFLKSKGVTSVRPLQPTGSISVRSLMER